MPSNDTQNIYSTEYGGSGAPIPASKISYDNTDSGLTSDDVQNAVDEIAGDISDVETDVSALKTNVTLKKGTIGEDNNLTIYQQNNIVLITGYKTVASMTANEYVTLGSIPEGFLLPDTSVRIDVAYSDQAYNPPQGFVYLTIDEGNIKIKSSENLTNKVVYFSFSYVGIEGD